MFKQLTDLAKSAIYYGVAFALVLTIALASRGGNGNLAGLLSMMTPVFAVLVMLLVVTRDGRTQGAWQALGLDQSGWRTWGAALFLPALLLLAAYGIIWRTSYATFAMPDGVGPLDLVSFTLSNFAVTLVFAMTEEIGWRGYLLPRLLPLGVQRATLLTGLLHGIFHLPLLLLTPFYHSTGDRLIVVPMFLLALTLAGAIYGYLRLTTNSVWPVAITHTSLNVTWNLLVTLTAVSSPVAVEYLAGESGLLPLLGYAVVAGWCLYRLAGQAGRAAATAAPIGQAAATPVR